MVKLVCLLHECSGWLEMAVHFWLNRMHCSSIATIFILNFARYNMTLFLKLRDVYMFINYFYRVCVTYRYG